MEELELVLSEFYKFVGEKWPEDMEFWSGFGGAELSHAEYISKIRNLLNENPSEFEIGRPLTVQAINSVIAGVKNLIQRVGKGEYNQKQILFLSRDIEQSVLESKYAEILRTKNIEYQKLINQVVSQTEMHKMLLLRKISETK